MRRTPFQARTAALARHHLWFNWDGSLVVDVYHDVREELRAIRERVAMCEMSPLSKFDVRGPDAARLIDRVTTRDVTTHHVHQVRYSPACDEDGKVVSELLIFRMADDLFRLSADPVGGWLRKHAEGLDVEIDDVTDDLGILAVQGPRSVELMEILTGERWSELPFSRIRETGVAGSQLIVARQGFTGELGFELWVSREVGPDVWDAVVEAGERLGVSPAGEHAIEIARIEAGMLIPGADYARAGPDRLGTQTETETAHEASPFELGMGRFVDLAKADFVGRDALLREAEDGAARTRLTGLVVDRAALARLADAHDVPTMVPARVSYYPMKVLAGDRGAGRATSITWSPTLHAIIAFGHLDQQAASPGTKVEVSWRHEGTEHPVPATIVPLPFLDLRRS